MSQHLKHLLQADMESMTPNVMLEQKLETQLREKIVHRRSGFMRISLFVGAVSLALVAVVVTNIPQSGPPSLIAQANAAYAELRTKLSEPGAVRHIVMKTVLGEDGETISSESWANGDYTKNFMQMSNDHVVLRLDEKIYIPSTDLEEKSNDECRISKKGDQICTISFTEGEMPPEEGVEGEGSMFTSLIGEVEELPKYVMTTPENVVSFQQWLDPQDESVFCVDVKEITEEQRAARKTMNEIHSASEGLSTGAGNIEALLKILETSANITDRGVQIDAEVGEVHLYRISYGTIGNDPNAVSGFNEFGFDPDTGMLRIIRQSWLDASGTEHNDVTTYFIVDEVLSAYEISEDFFSPEYHGFVEMVIPEALETENHPEDLPVYFLQNGCYREGGDVPEWLSPQEEAAARARIEAFDYDTPSLGGGGW